MKRFAAVLAALMVVTGCAAQVPVAELPPVTLTDPEQTAQGLWPVLTGESLPQLLSREEICLLLALEEDQLEEAVACFRPEEPQSGQLFLLRAAPKEETAVAGALEHRLELVRQSALWLGETEARSYGLVWQKDNWCALLVPGTSGEEGVQQLEKALRMMQEAFE